MEFSFYKLHLAGNDLILADLRTIPEPPDEILSRSARRSCRRRTGIGGAGIIYLLPGTERKVRIRFFTPGGIESRLISDAQICAGRYLFDSGLFEKGHLEMETVHGISGIDAIDSAHFRIGLGVPTQFEGGPPLKESPSREYSLSPLIAGKRYTVTPVCLGSCSGVIFSFEPGKEKLREISRGFRESKDDRIRGLQPVFVSVYSQDGFGVVPRFSGTVRDHSAAAAGGFVAGVVQGFLDREADGLCHGASFYLQWTQPSDMVYCTGTAEYAFYGTYYDDEESETEEESEYGSDI